MVKIFTFSIIIILGGLFSLAGKRIYTNPTQINPYPYKFMPLEANDKIIDKAKQASSAQVLIIGDHLALPLTGAIPDMVLETSKKVKGDLQYFNWAARGEGIHRSLYKIKQLTEVPEIVVYFGGSEEFFEKTFNSQNIQQIMYNFKLRENDFIASLLILWDYPSRLIYRPVKYQLLPVTAPEISPPFPLVGDLNYQRIVELKFKLFKYMFEEMMDIIILAGKTPVIVIPPINYEVAPKKICEKSTNERLDAKIFKLAKIIQADPYNKEAYQKLLNLKKQGPFHAQISYLLAIIEIKNKKFIQALKYYQDAHIYDCQFWRGHVVFNAIMKNYALKNKITTIDLDQRLIHKLGRDTLFLDDVYPHNITYEFLSSELIGIIKTVLQL